MNSGDEVMLATSAPDDSTAIDKDEVTVCVSITLVSSLAPHSSLPC